jgi:hypothetical protein
MNFLSWRHVNLCLELIFVYFSRNNEQIIIFILWSSFIQFMYHDYIKYCCQFRFLVKIYHFEGLWHHKIEMKVWNTFKKPLQCWWSLWSQKIRWTDQINVGPIQVCNVKLQVWINETVALLQLQKISDYSQT